MPLLLGGLLLNVHGLLNQHLFPVVNVHVMVVLHLRLGTRSILAVDLRIGSSLLTSDKGIRTPLTSGALVQVVKHLLVGCLLLVL